MSRLGDQGLRPEGSGRGLPSPGRGILSGVVLALLLGSTSCGGGEERAGGGAGAGGGGRPAMDAAETKKRRAELEKDIETISKALVKAPLDYKSTVANCEKYGAQAREAGLKDLAERCDKIKADAKGAYDHGAERELKDAAEKVHAYLAAGDMDKAKVRARGIAKVLWTDEKYLPQIDEIMAELKRAERAETYFKRVTQVKVESFKSRSEFERASGVCQAFLAIPAFSMSPRRKDVEQMLASLAPEIEKAKAAKAKDEGVKPLPAFTGNEAEIRKIWDCTDESMLTVADKVLTFKHGAEESTISMRCGAEDWEEYRVEISLRILEGEAYVNAHGILEGDEEKHWSFKPGAAITTAEYGGKDRWYVLKLDVRGKELSYTPPGSGAPVTKKLASDKGPFEIRLTKRGTILQVKSIWVKVLKPAGTKLPE